MAAYSPFIRWRFSVDTFAHIHRATLVIGRDVFLRECQLRMSMLDLSFSVLMLVGFADELGSRVLRTPINASCSQIDSDILSQG